MNTASVESAFWPAAKFSWSNGNATLTAVVNGGLPFELGATKSFDFGVNDTAMDRQGNTLASAFTASVSLAAIQRADLHMAWLRHSSGGSASYSWFVIGDTGGGSAVHAGASFDTSGLPPYSAITTLRSARLFATVHETWGPAASTIVAIFEHFNHGRSSATLFDSTRLVTGLGMISFGNETLVEFDTFELDITEAFDSFWSDPSRPDTDFSIRTRPRYIINNGYDDAVRLKRWNAVDGSDNSGPPPANERSEDGFRLVVEYL